MFVLVVVRCSVPIAERHFQLADCPRVLNPIPIVRMCCAATVFGNNLWQMLEWQLPHPLTLELNINLFIHLMYSTVRVKYRTVVVQYSSSTVHYRLSHTRAPPISSSLRSVGAGRAQKRRPPAIFWHVCSIYSLLFAQIILPLERKTRKWILNSRRFSIHESDNTKVTIQYCTVLYSAVHTCL